MIGIQALFKFLDKDLMILLRKISNTVFLLTVREYSISDERKHYSNLWRDSLFPFLTIFGQLQSADTDNAKMANGQNLYYRWLNSLAVNKIKKSTFQTPQIVLV